MHPPPACPASRQKPCLQPIASELPPWQEFVAPRLAADQGKAQEVEGLGLALPALLASGRRMVAEPDQAGLFRMRRQRELLQPRPRHIEEPTNVGLGVTAKPSWPGVTRTSPAIFAG